jgi:hypothetical protein
LQQEQLAMRFVLLLLGALRQVLLLEIPCRLRVFAFFIRELVQQLPRRSVGRSGDRPLVETLRFELHHFGLPPRHVHAQGPQQPGRPPLQEAFHVFAADQRNVIAKPLAEHRQQAIPVHGFFLPHFFKHFCCRRIGFPQSVGEFSVNAPVLFFGRDGQRQNLFLRQILELFQHPAFLAFFRGSSIAQSPSRSHLAPKNEERSVPHGPPRRFA